MDYAILTNDKDYTIFKFKDYVLKFKAPYSLQWYSKVTKWNDGYIEVMTKYNAHASDNELSEDLD